MRDCVRSRHGTWRTIIWGCRGNRGLESKGGHELHPLYFGATEVRMTLVGTDPVISLCSSSII